MQKLAHYKAIVAYDGTDFAGFQLQTSERTVQGELEGALSAIGWQGRHILAAGRTDAGVHASGQVVAFALPWRHGDQALRKALNANLPQDISVRNLGPAAAEFHPRFDAHSRTYVYSLLCQPVRNPLRERYAWRVWPAPQLSFLQRAAAALVGSHDFGAFGSPPRQGGSTIRNVLRSAWVERPDSLRYEVTANAFLYHMVRKMVQLQVDLAQRGAPDRILDFLENPGSSFQGLAPARGLTLVRVDYGAE